MDKDYTLTVRLRPALDARLTRYAKRIGMTKAGAVRCAIAAMEESEGGEEMEAELTKLIARLEKKRLALRPSPPDAAGNNTAQEKETP